MYTWSLGDGPIESGQVVSHAYGRAGTFTAVVTASNRMNSVTATTSVEVIPWHVYLPVLMRRAET